LAILLSRHLNGNIIPLCSSLTRVNKKAYIYTPLKGFVCVGLYVSDAR